MSSNENIQIIKLPKKKIKKNKDSSNLHPTKNGIQGNWSLIVIVPTDRFLHGLGVTLGLIKARATCAKEARGQVEEWGMGVWGVGSHKGHIMISSLNKLTQARKGRLAHTQPLQTKVRTRSGAPQVVTQTLIKLFFGVGTLALLSLPPSCSLRTTGMAKRSRRE